MLVEAQIREALKALMSTIDVCRDHIVFDSLDIAEQDEGHWVVVTTGNEVIDQNSIGNSAQGSKQTHTCELNIDLIRMARKKALEGAEVMLEQIVPVVFADRRLGGLVKSFRVVGKTRDKSTDGFPMARIRLQCETVYQTFDRDPSTSV